MPNLPKDDLVVNLKSPKSIKRSPELYADWPIAGRYAYPVPINIVLKRIVDRQFQINTQKLGRK